MNKIKILVYSICGKTLGGGTDILCNTSGGTWTLIYSVCKKKAYWELNDQIPPTLWNKKLDSLTFTGFLGFVFIWILYQVLHFRVFRCFCKRRQVAEPAK